MNPILKNILAVVVGWIAGSLVNISLILIGPMIIPLPEGVNPMDSESLEAGMELFENRHFIFPLLAHALGTLVGALVAAKISASHHLYFALGMGLLFLIGGIMNINNLGGPMWFIVADLVLAYFPMAYLGHKLSGK